MRYYPVVVWIGSLMVFVLSFIGCKPQRHTTREKERVPSHNRRSVDELLRRRGHRKAVTCLAFSPDGNRLASGGDDAEVIVWDVPGQRELSRWRVPTSPSDVAARNHGALKIAVVSLRDFLRDNNAIESVSFSRNATQVVACAFRGMYVWSIQPNGRVLRVEGKEWRASSVSTGGQRVVSARIDGVLKLWSTDSGLELGHHKGDLAITSMAWSVDGRRFVLSVPGWVELWDAEALKTVRKIATGSHSPTVASLSPIGTLVAFGGGSVDHKLQGPVDCFVHVYDTQNGQEVVKLAGHTGPITGVCFAPDGDHVVSVSLDRTARLWNLPRRRMVWSLNLGTRPGSVTFSPKGRRIAVGCMDGSIITYAW